MSISILGRQKFFSKLVGIDKATFTMPEDTVAEPMALLFEQLESRYNESDCDYLNNLARCQRLIISNTKKGNFKEAEEIINLAERALESLRYEAKTLGTILVFPSFAYNATKKGDFFLAKKYVGLIVENDDLLTEKFPILHLHKIHHVLNLNQVFTANGEYKECGDFFVDVFKYLTSFELNPKYGLGGARYFEKLPPKYGLEQVSIRFIDEYFLNVWENLEVEKYVVESISELLRLEWGGDTNDKFLKAWKEMCEIQISIHSKKPNFNFILEFFNNYDYYLYDPLRLLILRCLYIFYANEEEKSVILEIVNKKLNFKRTDLLAKRISLQSKIAFNERAFS